MPLRDGALRWVWFLARKGRNYDLVVVCDDRYRTVSRVAVFWHRPRTGGVGARLAFRQNLADT